MLRLINISFTAVVLGLFVAFSSLFSPSAFATCRVIMEETGYNDPHCPTYAGCTQICPTGACYSTWECYADGGFRWRYWASDSNDCWCPSCFLPGTQVSTPQGEKPIETLKPGDEVYSFDELTGKKLLNVVQNSPVRTVPQYYIIKTESGREVKVTAEHPFLTKSKEDQSEGGVLGGLGRLGELVRFIKSKISGVVRVSYWL